MEEIYVNVEYDKSDSKMSQNQTGPRSPESRFHGAVVLFLGLLNVFLLALLICLGVLYHNSIRGSAADFSTIKANLTERLQASDNRSSSLTEARDLLNASLVEMAKELKKLQNLSKQGVPACEKTCPAGWTMFSYACYFLSDESGSWDKGREYCRGKGADLVVITSTEEQRFLLGLTKKPSWIGLNDRDVEGTWKWIDGTPLNLTYWHNNQPDNGGGSQKWGEEDCAHIRTEWSNHWNDLSCNAALQWICEKIA
ncbi:CD209 antigen-like protein E [Siniperca chuatsi]|uniref:CD209 antigen-like protein E n=1 Tax=Siniperca chuatsi TaxID=119488 RepID=UPI001CE17AF5|nr:CD209 antigen-like protein E [Siniperca chuatsi]XP_044073433.1 CD209 antigen-like protein E [Siniperca chuatsi]XP_044073434.1 CD209 antigen-like protein E [Siniperca chuatsi]XP_044073435.1 CD209 antigen-like protein E [Siniperca chuatsi]XP_044073436.1 CD209 antigen-like protein E [Siniperca chuatsi]XP_044073437.1 CD209 antigen-like protein E [Siniperca chuatsi]